MPKEPIPRGVGGLIHPVTGSYILQDDDGNIRIGTEEFGDAIFIRGTTGEVFINANRIHFICDDIEWNNLVFNKGATNPGQPAFKPKQPSIASQELARYGK